VSFVCRCPRLSCRMHVMALVRKAKTCVAIMMMEEAEFAHDVHSDKEARKQQNKNHITKKK
jgi:hypothetical protein